MLAKVNGQQMAPERQPLDANEEQDVDISASFLSQALLSPESNESIVTALSSPEPAKALAVILVQVIEMVQTQSSETDIPMSPRVWVAEGGAIDDVADDIQMVAEDAGIPLEVEPFLAQVKQEVAVLAQKRGEDIQAQGASPQGQAPQGVAPQGLAQGGMV